MSHLTPVTSNFTESEKDFKQDITHVEHAQLDPLAEEGDAELAQYTDSSIVIDEATNKRLLRLLNRRVLPIMVGTYFCQTFDKGTLAFASIMGLREDNNLVGQQYALLGTALYLSYLVFELPMNLLLQRLPVAKFLSTIVFVWGVSVFCHAAASNFAGLLACRLILGVFESAVQPTLMVLTTMYYRKEEQPLILALWYSQQGFQLIVSGLLSFGLTHLKGGALRPWQALFVLVGALTVIWSLVIGLFLPDSPMRAKCWSEEDKVLLVERLRINENAPQNKEFKWEQVREALTDPVVWIIWTMQISIFIPVAGLASFANIIVRDGLGFSVRNAQLLNVAQGAISICIYASSAWASYKTKQTVLVMIVWLLPALAGSVVLATIPVTKSNAPGMLIAFYAVQFVISTGNLLWSLISRNIAGQTKKSVVNTGAFLAYATGCIIGPQVFQAKAAPRYISAWIAHIVIYGVYILLAILLRIILMRRNVLKRRAATGSDDGEDKLDHSRAFTDQTDRLNPNFRYVF